MNVTAVLYALLSAALFASATPIAKILVGQVDPWLLAGLFYIGSGVGLGLVRLARSRDRAEAPLARRDLPWLAGAILFGGAVGPVLLMLGFARTPAATVSLLLTLEGAASAVIAWVAFRENVDRRIAAGMALILAGAAVLAWREESASGDFLGIAAVIGACLAWGLDNNLTRQVSHADPVQIAMLKGLVAGPVSLALAFAGGAAWPSLGAGAAALATGFLGYGVSLVLFVMALRELGTARTAAYYGTAPFIGALAALLFLGEAPTPALIVAGILMAVGVTLHLIERHEHEHEHVSVDHVHRHVHDDHHAHAHASGDPPSEPHSHRHAHLRLWHRHRHLPDSHHRHSH
jgi:drug/metabolite transporter (DMT)-like permease